MIKVNVITELASTKKIPFILELIVFLYLRFTDDHGTTDQEKMPVNGLLLTLTEDTQLAEVTLSEIKKNSDIELGDRTDRWQPVVVESEGTRGSHEVHEWLESLPGVMMVDVIFSSVNEPPKNL